MSEKQPQAGPRFPGVRAPQPLLDPEAEKRLTDRQKEILEFIASTVDQRGVAPTFREIGDALGIRSTNGVADHVKALERKGYIERPGGRGSARSIRLTDRATGSFHDESTVAVPLIGRVAAGRGVGRPLASSACSHACSARSLAPNRCSLSLTAACILLTESGIAFWNPSRLFRASP